MSRVMSVVCHVSI